MRGFKVLFISIKIQKYQRTTEKSAKNRKYFFWRTKEEKFYIHYTYIYANMNECIRNRFPIVQVDKQHISAHLSTQCAHICVCCFVVISLINFKKTYTMNSQQHLCIVYCIQRSNVPKCTRFEMFIDSGLSWIYVVFDG